MGGLTAGDTDPAPAAPHGGTITILVADDTANIRQILVHILERSGYQTVQAMDGEEALSLARMQKFDLILLDIMMPKLNGFAVCEDLRRDEKTRAVPIIMVTAKGTKDAVLQAVRAGADDYIVKPFTAAVILGKIRKVVDRQRGRQEAR